METVKGVTPVGTVKFPKTLIGRQESKFVYVPDGYQEARGDSWSLVLTLNPNDEKVKELTAFLDAEHAKIQGANFQPYKLDEDGKGNLTGLIAINFKSSYPPAILDSKLKPCKATVTWGSKVAISFNVKPVDNQGKIGLGRYMKAIQVIELAASNTDHGFVETEGFTAPVVKDEAVAWSE